MTTQLTAAGMSASDTAQVRDRLQDRLVSMLDMSLTLKHAHWNVVGPGFMAVHELFDRQVEKVRTMSDEIAERIATLGGIPNGLAGTIVSSRTWDDYPIGRGVVEAHLAALDRSYDGMIEDHRKAIHAIEPIDAVTADLLVQQTGSLELMQWFVRAHIENTSGSLPFDADASGLDAAAAAAVADPRD